MCAARFDDTAEWSEHLVECGNRQRTLKKFGCRGCDYAAVKKCDLDRHVKRTGHDETHQASGSEDEWENQDPGALLSPLPLEQEEDQDGSIAPDPEESDVVMEAVGDSSATTSKDSGPTPEVPSVNQEKVPYVRKVVQDPTVRKRTSPLPGITSRPKAVKPSSSREQRSSTDQFTMTGVHGFIYSRLSFDASTQTEAPVKTVTKKQTITYDKEGKRIVKEVITEQWVE
ncbi:uncharacterized protein LOC110454599 [Mizuhopecten yessoensis]|uniref:C2H2-type domain-containing protein n=1 Tax=Mizuhopecten yessoensis TaxID=6573 RepID=A0A210QEX2_MIZYE|nr:uncharacterized protein LOC110454599 [Mizuhopecten yessoensis]OWF47259.1 hypothetical protein KP79_PYT05872 [Mizuhopecten yessoensis]